MLTQRLIVLLAMTVGSTTAAFAQASDCSRDAFSRVVDGTAGALRRQSAETQPRILAGMRQLKQRHGWRDEDESERARELLSDAETVALDQKAAQLLATMDRLSEEGGQGPVDCIRLGELKAAAEELQTTVRTKSDLVLKRINAALAMRSTEPLPGQPVSAVSKPPSLSTYQKPPATVARVEAAMPTEAARPPVAPLPVELPRAATPPPATVAAAPLAAPIVGEWRVTTTPQTVPDLAPAPSLARPLTSPSTVASIQLPPPAAPPAAKTLPASDTYSIDEIRAAAKDISGTISANLGKVIEYAFSQYGRPTAYVIGEEGGGAFIAGVRYGSGRLFMKKGKGSKIYWHGPSVGYDFGASGSKTLFLIYKLDDVRELYTGFSGIDGSAYFIGGAGITFLSNDKVIMAPIRTGLGFRLGANVGYLKFSPKATWNPF